MKKQLTLHKMCVTTLLCGPWADLCPLYGLYCKRFSLYIKVCQGGGEGGGGGGGEHYCFPPEFLDPPRLPV